MKDFQDIIFELQKKRAVVILNRPRKHNAFRLKTLKELLTVFQHLKNVRDVRCVVIRGAGDVAFCAGGDIEEMAGFTRREAEEFLLLFAEFLMEIRRAPFVVISAVNGYCFGGGMEINLACDLSVASEKAKFAQRGLFLGLAPVMGGPQFLPYVAGDKKAREVVFLGKVYSADEAFKMGIVNEVVKHEALGRKIEELMDALSAPSREAICVTKRAFFESCGPLEKKLKTSARRLAKILTSKETKEVLREFLTEKNKKGGKR